MATVPQDEVRVILGVDTREDVHVAVALDQLGRWLGNPDPHRRLHEAGGLSVGVGCDREDRR